MSEPGHITLWMPESDPNILAAVGKLAEEASELSGRCARSIIQGLEAIDPETMRTNRREMEREIADVEACIANLRERYGIQPMPQRTDGKLIGYRRWHDLIDDEMGNTPVGIIDPIKPTDLAPPKMHRDEARGKGFTGNSCATCGSMQMQIAGHCEVCSACGSTTGCS